MNPTIPSDNGNNLFTVYNSSSLNTGINLTIDTRDKILAPQKGILFENTYIFKSKKINGPDEFITDDLETSISQQKLELDLSYYQSTFSKQVIALSLHAREMKGGFYEISDLYKLGGTNSLRGYRENQFLGNRIFWSNLEYRLLLSNKTYSYLFFDTGYYLRDEDKERNVIRTEAFNYGYGFWY